MREWHLQRITTAPEIDPVLAHLNLRYLCQRDPEGLSADIWSMGFFVRIFLPANWSITDCLVVRRSGNS